MKCQILFSMKKKKKKKKRKNIISLLSAEFALSLVNVKVVFLVKMVESLSRLLNALLIIGTYIFRCYFYSSN